MKKRKEPKDDATRVTELEAVTFARLDSDIRFHIVSTRNADLELDILYRNYLAKKAEYENNRAISQQQLNVLKPQYVEFSKELAERYHVNPAKMVIDPDSRIIREI